MSCCCLTLSAVTCHLLYWYTLALLFLLANTWGVVIIHSWELRRASGLSPHSLDPSDCGLGGPDPAVRRRHAPHAGTPDVTLTPYAIVVVCHLGVLSVGGGGCLYIGARRLLVAASGSSFTARSCVTLAGPCRLAGWFLASPVFHAPYTQAPWHI